MALIKLFKSISDKVTFESFSTKDGLPSDYILSCMEDVNGDCLLKMEFRSLLYKHVSFKTSVFYDGLSDVAFSEGPGSRRKNGDLIFGSLTGFWSFNPGDIGKRKISANLALTRFQINNNDVVPGDILTQKLSVNNSKKIKLQHYQNTISIDFAVLDYRLGESDNYI